MRASEFDMLDLLAIYGYSVPIYGLAKHTGQSEDTTYGRLKRLLKNGLVVCDRGKYPAMSDGRGSTVTSWRLSEAGYAAYEAELRRMERPLKPAPRRRPTPAELIARAQA